MCVAAEEWGEANSPVTWFCPDSSEQVTKDRNNLKMVFTKGWNPVRRGSRTSRLLEFHAIPSFVSVRPIGPWSPSRYWRECLTHCTKSVKMLSGGPVVGLNWMKVKWTKWRHNDGASFNMLDPEFFELLRVKCGNIFSFIYHQSKRANWIVVLFGSI